MLHAYRQLGNPKLTQQFNILYGVCQNLLSFVGEALSLPLRRSRSAFNEPLCCVSFGRLRASPTHMIPFNEHGCGDSPQMQKGTAEAVPLWIIC